MPLRFLFLALILAAEAFADTITMKDGNSFDGLVVRISDQSVFLKAGRETSEFRRTAVDAITFASSDLVVLTSRDTLKGKVLRKENGHIVIATEQELKVVEASSVVEILPSIGQPMRLGEIAQTGDAFHVEAASVDATRSHVFFSVYAGIHSVTYSRGGKAILGPPAFDKSVSGVPYGFEVGVDISSRISATLGMYRFNAKTEIPERPGQVPASEVGYSVFAASGVLRFFTKNGLDIFCRAQVALETANSSLYEGGNRYDSKQSVAFVPGIGVQYALGPFFLAYSELDWHFSTLKLKWYGDTIDTMGPAVLAGVRVYLPKLSF